MRQKSILSLLAVGLSSLVIAGCVSEGGSYEQRSPSVYRERVIIDRNDDRGPRRDRNVYITADRDRDVRPSRDVRPGRDVTPDRDRNDRDRANVRNESRDRDRRQTTGRCETPRCIEQSKEDLRDERRRVSQ